MLTNERKMQIEGIAMNLLNSINYIDDMVDVTPIIKRQGYEIYVDDELDNNILGYTDYEKREIVLNANETPERRRFTLAHELGCIMLNNYTQCRYDITSNQLNIYANEQNDVEANYFAECILMPRNIFVREFNSIKEDIDFKVQKLAYYFGVSKLAVYVRTNMLNLVDI